MTEHKEEMNHQAYQDVVDIEAPRYPDDVDYMDCYRFWYACDPCRFDPYGQYC